MKTFLWTDIPFASQTAAQQALERVQQIADEWYPDLESFLVDFAKTTTFQTPSTLDRAREQVALVEAVTDTLSRYAKDLFQHNLEQCLQAGVEFRPGAGLIFLWPAMLTWQGKEMHRCK